MNKSVGLIIGMLASGIVQANGWTGNINVFSGNKSLDSDWGKFDSQGEFGIISDVGHQSWPFVIAIDVFVSADDDKNNESSSDSHVDAVTSEVMVGIRRYYDFNYAISPYVGGGITSGYGYREIKQSDGTYKDEDDRGFGLWIGGGVVWRPLEHFNVGFDVRYSNVEVDLFGEDLGAGGLHTGFTAGYHW
ncbi:outer membrane beta-barrel protein [Moritella sp. 36]|uniref:outer membrane protein n=1 Tax=Moritella sp. 36 TaxID=2746233 RepID=UPI001BAC2FCB|nr:outer membrane beta-barrel protein [Moritella sp. 36]QUM90544.1 outer membrane beta-barrel protein [Moritella sp. 36]